MKTGQELSLTFSQLQVASILANAFFCTFPHRNSRKLDKEFASYPLINFDQLFSDVSRRGASRIPRFVRKREKLRCLLHYFYRVTEVMPTGAITFTRRKLGDRVPDWANSMHSFDQFGLHVNASGTIESSGSRTIHVDFADPYVGGLILDHGCVQEEILFLLQPELIASCLFAERLSDDETFIIEGAEQYSRHTGYGNSFHWVGDFQQSATDMTRDEWGRWRRTIVAMDATKFSAQTDQFETSKMLRELNKAYCGFCDNLAPYQKLPSVVATGNWGCGIFRGNVYLKALLQMLACCEAGKSMAYYTFGDTKLRDDLYDMYRFLSTEAITVGK
ncbi:Cytosolic poly(ADP-ribose) glycohydrolase [Fasciolopsis buskii]|uniref:poly(ADP-ribose) glycohydrolase n=1 Tax=Fasciolopsis buskii TaxID=27845 RepID=A0A8E0VJ41_9TREM|nr:Cytosolic poly(ADP-ribose) glycohydrolase [Fasciolopsis buski]